MRCPSVRFPDQLPSRNELCGPHRGFVTWTNKRPRVCVVKNTHLKPSCHRVGTTTKRSPHQTEPDVCPPNGPGLSDHSPQSGVQPAHPLLFPSIDVKRSTRRQNPQSPFNFFPLSGAPSRLRLIRKATALASRFPFFDLRFEKNVGRRKWKNPPLVDCASRDYQTRIHLDGES
jgi:hypothetical protein